MPVDLTLQFNLAVFLCFSIRLFLYLCEIRFIKQLVCDFSDGSNEADFPFSSIPNMEGTLSMT